MRVKFFIEVDIPEDKIFSETNDLVMYGYNAIEDDFRAADSIDDFHLEFEILE